MWQLDRENGDVYRNGEYVGTADGPPYTIPDDVRQVALSEMLPNENASVRGEHLHAVLEISSGQVEFIDGAP